MENVGGPNGASWEESAMSAHVPQAKAGEVGQMAGAGKEGGGKGGSVRHNKHIQARKKKTSSQHVFLEYALPTKS